MPPKRRSPKRPRSRKPAAQPPAPDPQAEVGSAVLSAQRKGRPRLYDVGPDWREHYLDAYDRHGAKLYLAAGECGIHGATVRDEIHRSEEFALRVREITEKHADRLEQDMEDQARHTGNPVGYIVRLKALRPSQYLERHLAMTIAATTELESRDGRELIARALGVMLDSTREQVAIEARKSEAHVSE